MTDAIHLRQENQIIKDKISQIKKELDNPEEYNIEKIKIEDFQFDENDIPEIQSIKKKILKSLEIRNSLTKDYDYISNRFDSICKEKKINQAEFADIEKDYQQIKLNIENAEKNLYSKMEENKYETSKRKRGKIKNLLKENYNLRISKLKIIEELKVKRDQLTKLQNFTVNKKQNFNHCKDKIEKSSYIESEKFIRSKVTTSVSSRQKLLDLKKDIESIEFLKSIPDDILNSKESKELKNSINNMLKNHKEFELAKKNDDADPITNFLKTLSEKKNELNENRENYYAVNIKSFQKHLDYAEIKYQVKKDTKDALMKNLREISKSLKKFKDEIEKDSKKLEAFNSHLKEENSLFKSSDDSVEMNQAIGSKNDQYKLTAEEMRNLRFSHQGEINKICYMLNIPIMSSNETPNFVYRRILSAVCELKMNERSKNKNDPDNIRILEDSMKFLKQQNEKLTKMLDNSE